MTAPSHNSRPNHIAIIMDGNGRWAKEKGLSRTQGHREGVEAVTRTVDTCLQIGIPWLTLYAFSSENWNRPKLEVAALMELLLWFIKKQEPVMMRNNVRLHIIGDRDKLPVRCRRQLEKTMAATSGNTSLNLVLALSYGSRDEITDAARKIAEQVRDGLLSPDDVTRDIVSQNLYTAGMPDPDLLIRTSGERRLSNFLLWQLSYAEMIIIPKYWPDFTGDDLKATLEDYSRRHRRFGKI